jgi:hypothetical protein
MINGNEKKTGDDFYRRDDVERAENVFDGDARKDSPDGTDQGEQDVVAGGLESI